MSSIVTDRGLVHYEAHGRGRAVILLHGWLESWDHWLETMKSLGRSCKAYALDFWGFGESGKQGGGFAVRDYIEMVEQFMERLGIEQAPVIGHSMGGTVSLGLAIEHPERVQKVAVVGSPVVGDGLALFLRFAARRSLASLAYQVPHASHWESGSYPHSWHGIGRLGTGCLRAIFRVLRWSPFTIASLRYARRTYAHG